MSNAVALAHSALEAVTKLRMKGLFVDAIVINTVDWQRITSFGCQCGTQPKPLLLWGLPVIVSDDALLGKPMAATWGRL